ncbi:TauD/TfdA family dioxygenase [Nodularia chucula]|uniref:TauD/TfdA family dioxygenase n=1 Tax=Nodularia chucula TaxID=3093667 RepID=UPI0039C6B456
MTMKKLTTKNSSLKTLGNIRRKSVNLLQSKLIATEFLQPGKTLPLVMKPAIVELDLADWLADNQDLIETALVRHGAILFRGFNLDNALAFEQVCLRLCPELFNENGEHPRATISGKVYTPVFYPPEKQLLWHNENSFNHRWPRKIFFGCQQPAQQGGETPIVDSRQVFQRINPKIREQFMEKKVMYQRNYESGLGLDWQTVFQTHNQAEVEAICRQNLMNFTWKNHGGLRTRSVRPAVVRHPQTGEMCWFTQAQHWHISCLDQETRDSLLSLFPEEDLPRNCYYGDGSVIEDSIMEEICGIYQELEETFPWQTGDLLMLDNLLTAHGRNPFSGKRKLLVAMGELMNFDEINK